MPMNLRPGREGWVGEGYRDDEDSRTWGKLIILHFNQ